MIIVALFPFGITRAAGRNVLNVVRMESVLKGGRQSTSSAWGHTHFSIRCIAAAAVQIQCHFHHPPPDLFLLWNNNNNSTENKDEKTDNI